jgi:hypothetical protein
LLIALIFIAGQIYFIRNLYQLGNSIGLKSTHPYFVFISTQSDRMLIIASITSVVTLLIISFASLFLSHKIAGPIHNLTNWFKRMKSTDEKMTALKFRNGDFFDEIPDVINETLKQKNLIK